MTARPCLSCGDLTPTGTYCTDCKPPDKSSATARGYDWQWTKLSRRARRLQPFCSVCNGTTDLQADHSQKRGDGRTPDCPSACKTSTSSAEPTTASEAAHDPPVEVKPTDSRPVGKAKFESETA